MEDNKEYFVFISYSSLDNEWAIWLRHELEHYHLPASFNGRTDVRDNLRKVFRDRDELSAGPEWNEQVSKALAETNNLIVICSPNAAKSEAVNKEVEAFIALGKEDHIFPFIVEGDKPEDCFPPALKHSKLGGDVNKDGGRDSAFVKVVAGMLGVGFDSLWNRYEKEKAEEERKIREQRDKLLIMQSRFLAEKANDLVEQGDSYTARLLALEALPKDLENPDRPYVPEAEFALRNAVRYNNILLRGHRNLVCSANFDSQCNFIVSNSIDGNIKIWDIQRGVCVAEHDELNSNIQNVCFSKAGDKIIAGTRDGLIKIWNIENWECVNEIDGYYSGVSGNVQCHPNGKYILAPSFNNKLLMWNIEDGEIVRVINGDSDEEYEHFYHAVFSNDGRYIAAVDDMEYLRLYSAENGKLIRKYDYRSNYDALSFNSSGTLLAFGYIDNLYLLLVGSGEIFKVFNAHNSSVESVCFSPNDDYIASSDGEHIKIWEVMGTGKCLKVLNKASDNLFFSSDGRYLLFHKNNDINIIDLKGCLQLCKVGIGEETSVNKKEDPPKVYVSINRLEKDIYIRKLENHELICKLGRHTKEIRQVILSPNGKTLVSMSTNKECFLWDIEKGTLTRPLASRYETLSCPQPVAYDKSGQLLIAADYNKLDIINASTGDVVKTVLGNLMKISYVEFNLQDSMALSVDYSLVNIWDVETCNCIQTIKAQDNNFFLKAYFNPNNSQIVTISDSNHLMVSLWSIESGNLLYNFPCCYDASFSPDGEWLAAVSHGGEIYLLNTENFEIKSFTGDYHRFLFSRDARFLFISHAADLEVYNLNQCKVCLVLNHESNYFELQGSSPDGLYLITNEGNCVCVWDIKTGYKMYTISTKDSFSKPIYCDKGKKIEFNSFETLFSCYSLCPIKDLVSQIKEQLVNYQLTPEERKMYYLD